MIEEVLTFETKGEKHNWEIIHNLDEYQLNLLDFFISYGKHFPDHITDIHQFCMFVIVNGKQKFDRIQCFPKPLVIHEMEMNKTKNN